MGIRLAPLTGEATGYSLVLCQKLNEHRTVTNVISSANPTWRHLFSYNPKHGHEACKDK
jgi:hypothetical protein